jgi:hypothetical protein
MTKLTKVVYFDEPTALDYVEIRDQGRYLREIANEGLTKGEASASLKAKSPSLISMLFSAEAKTGVSVEGKQILKSSVSNTILTDFIKKAGRSKEIAKLEGYKLELTDETRLSLYTAITNAANGNIPMDDSKGMGMDVSKLGSVLLDLHGYLECFAVKGNDKVVLRFNHAAFRNEYRLTDILNMDLVYYAVKVGVSSSSSLVSLGLDFTKSNQNVQDKIEKVLEQVDNTEVKKELEVYDIILAGVFYAK